MVKPVRLTRADLRHFTTIQTRWQDNDVFGHVNNVVYYAWFDTAVNGWLIDRGLLDPAASSIIGLVVETGCSYAESIAFPEPVSIGIAIDRLGSSSVRYRIGVFREHGDLAIAQGHFTHVYVDRASQRPVPIPDAIRAAMARLLA
ncbi:MAG: thioesterase family protein [Hyphomicrobiales bacterium]|nr:thioesterase family protein [Hyphomicrobiales bacterium]